MLFDEFFPPRWVEREACFGGRSSAPEILEPIGGQLGVAYGVLNVPVAKIGLQAARVVPFVGQGEAAGMAQHMRMRLEAEPGGLTSALHHAQSQLW